MKKISINKNLDINNISNINKIGEIKLTNDVYKIISDHIEKYIIEYHKLPKIIIDYAYLRHTGIVNASLSFEEAKLIKK